MLLLAWRSLRTNPTRYLLTGLAVALGVGFYVATTVLTATVDRSISGSVDDFFSGTDAAVRSTDVIDTGFIDLRSPLEPELVDEVAAVDGVDAVAPSLTGYAALIGSDGKVVNDSSNVIVWTDNEVLNGYRLVEGRAPTTVTEVLVDTDALDDGELVVGDEVRILPAQSAVFTVVGSMEVPGGGGLQGQSGLALTFDGVTTLFGNDDITTILVAADEGVSPSELVTRLDDSLSGPVEAVTGQTLSDELKEIINQFVSIISIFLTAFAAVALFVALFVIYNTFSITVTQRLKEMALLRAIGASSRQVLRNVLVESIAIGIIASLIGLAVGVALGAVLLRVFEAIGFPLGGDSLTIVPANLAVGFVIGVVVTIVSAYLPARRGAAVPPIEALRDSTIEVVGASRLRTRVGAGLIVVGVVLAAGGATNLRLPSAIAGIAALFGGIVLAAPAIAPSLARLLGRPVERARGIVGEIASENAARNPKRTATTALALMIGVTLVTAATVIASSFRESIRGDLDRALSADLVIEAGSGFQGGIEPDLTDRIAELPAVDGLTPVRTVNGQIDGDIATVNGVFADTVGSLVDMNVLRGDLQDLSQLGVALSESEADDLRVDLGDPLTLQMPAATVELTVVAIYERDDVVGNVLVDTATTDAGTTQPLDALVLVGTDDPAAATAAIEDLVASDPTAEVKTARQYADDQAGQLNTLLNLLYGLLALSVLIALIGVTNTMSLSIHERTRELGLMRAVGMTGPQLRSAIRYESSLVALVGSIGGIVLGVFFGWLTYRATRDTFPVFDIPWTILAVIAVVGVLAGVVAGWRPAARASRLNVLEAISH
ncbi:MAG: FtsX-like permease family protein [Actinomycetota bacterium]